MSLADDDQDSSTPASGDRVDQFAASLLEDTREELVRADTKAALLLASSGIAIGALLNGLLGGRWSPFDLANSVEWMWWLGIASSSAAIVCLGVAVYPRTRRRYRRSNFRYVGFYGDVVAVGRNQLSSVIRTSAELGYPSAIDQIYTVSQIVNTKYRYVRISLVLLAVAGFLCAASILLNLATSAYGA